MAIKKLIRPFLITQQSQRTYREIRVLKHINHENLIGLTDIFTPDIDPKKLQDVYLVTPLMDTTLADIIKTGTYNGDHVRFYVYCILRALKYLHSTGIIHRDLKPANILINNNNDLRIVDFGLARRGGDSMTGYVVTRWYRSPEVMFNWMKYDEAVDIWSVGCVMAEMLLGHPLIRGSDHIDQLLETMSILGTPSDQLLSRLTSQEAINFIASLPPKKPTNLKDIFGSTIDEQGLDLLKKMLDMDPKSRITATEALAHPYLKIFSDPEDEPVAESQFENLHAQSELDIPAWKDLVFNEILTFQPKDLK